MSLNKHSQTTSLDINLVSRDDKQLESPRICEFCYQNMTCDTNYIICGSRSIGVSCCKNCKETRLRAKIRQELLQQTISIVNTKEVVDNNLLL